jgi:peptidoglycan/xylan/chitin deacetylase (PgdA/CDA1 family)
MDCFSEYSTFRVKVVKMGKDFRCYVALTFDDGTINQYHTIKTLSKFNIRCTIFCIACLKKHPYTNRQLLASEPEKIQELHSLGHEVGSHTCTHPYLTDIKPEKLRFELERSKRILEDITGSEVLGFAYPNSMVNSEAIEEIRKYYGYARTGGHTFQMLNEESHLYRIPSIGAKKLLTVPFRKMCKRGVVVVMIHDISAAVLLPLVCYLKATLRAEFTTMKEAISILEHSRYALCFQRRNDA